MCRLIKANIIYYTDILFKYCTLTRKLSIQFVPNNYK